MIRAFWNWITRHEHDFKRARKGQDPDKTHCRCGETRAVKRRKPKGAS